MARGHRLLAAVVASLLFVATVLGISRARTAGEEAPVAAQEATPSPPVGATDPPSPSPSPSPVPSPDADPSEALTDPEAAAALGADRLLAAGLATAQGPWRDLGHPTWPTRNERPVYVGAVSVEGPRVTADLVIATRLTDPDAELVLRFLPAARALGEGTDLDVGVTVDGTVVEPTVDRDGARLVVPLGRERGAGESVLLRLDVAYDLVPVAAVVDDGGPAAFGLLADHPGVASLGHWLPLLTLPGEDGPMVPWGDVGGFPVAVWSLVTTHAGTLLTGGRDGPCPGESGPTGGPACTWARGIALRDVSAVLYDEEPVVVETEVAGVRHRAASTGGTAAAAEAVLAEAVGASASFEQRFGALAWNEVDTVAVPLGRGAAGMEFPGLSLIDDEQWTRVDGAFGTAVIVHEVAHQWFHALVGNGSLTSPVVDESLAQYLSYLYWRDRFGDAAARDYARGAFLGRYAAAQERGVPEEAPAQPLADFSGPESYGVMVYARSPLAWLAAEDELGVEVVEAFLAQVVSRYGLEVVSDRQLVEDAFAFSPALGAILQRTWFTDEPLG